MKEKIISGIQQMGIGIPNVHQAWAWYREHFGMDVKVFEEAAEAALMIDYTGNEVHARHAILALNMQGGGGMEIWQFTSREPQLPSFEPLLGDLGILVCKIKCKDVAQAYKDMQQKGLNVHGDLSLSPDGRKHFFVRDPWDNVFQVVENADDDWFKMENHQCGGVYGSIIGVSDIEESLKVYRDILGFDRVVYDEVDTFMDFRSISGGDRKLRRVLLSHSKPHQGGFSKLLGSNRIELVQWIDGEGRKLFKDRFWGDRGFIHLCFDIQGMQQLQAECEAKGRPFVVDSSNSFDMGEAAGHFAYIEDPDGTMIEFVETHKVPIVKKFGWYLNLKNRKPGKNLPDWMIKAMGLFRPKPEV